MTKLTTIFRSLFLTLFLCIFLVACSRITQDNFAKINTNMTMKEVVAILGEPTNAESVNIAGISGTAATLKAKNAEINIQFLNDKVTVKTFSKLDEKSQAE